MQKQLHLKKTAIIFLLLLVPLSAFSQPRKYRKSMEKAALMLDEAAEPGAAGQPSVSLSSVHSFVMASLTASR
jgi:hypothetical protein